MLKQLENIMPTAIKTFKQYPKTVNDLPLKEEVYVLFEEDSYGTDHGYPKDGISQVPILKLELLGTLAELRAEVARRLSPANYYGHKKFSIAKLVPMSYNINIETAITLSWFEKQNLYLIS